MPDYSACRNVKCALRVRCGRYRMVWDAHWQSVSCFRPDTDTDGSVTCHYLMDVDNGVPFKLVSLVEADAFNDGFATPEPVVHRPSLQDF